MTSSPPDPSLPARLREFHERLPLAGDPPNAVLALPDDRILYLAAILRDTPQPPPAMTAEEWQAFLDLLKPHGVYPLMAYRLRAWPADCRPPAEVMDYLNRLFLYAAARSMRAGRQIQGVVDALEVAGIPSVLLKGPALARTVYPDPALRQSGDIDLLVRPGDVLAAEAVLEGLGYHCGQKGFVVSQHQYNHDIFEPPGEGTHIELHWALDSAYDLFPQDWVDQVIARRVPIDSDDLACLILGPGDHLLFLAYHHGFQHESVRLDWITDTSGLITALPDPVAWPEIVNQAIEDHLRIPLELLTMAARLWTGREIPVGAGDYITWPAPTEQEIRLQRHAPAHHNSLISYIWLILKGQRGTVEKLCWGWRFVFPPTPMLTPYRKSTSRFDIPLAHLRRWGGFVKYI